MIETKIIYLNASLVLLSLFSVQAATAQATKNPFDPSAYIESQPLEKDFNEVSSVGVYKIEGKRYQTFYNKNTFLLLPGEMEITSIDKSQALCSYHLDMFDESFKIREGLAVPTTMSKKLLAEINLLLRECEENTIQGPIKTIETRDGAILEVEAKKDVRPDTDPPLKPGIESK